MQRPKSTTDSFYPELPIPASDIEAPVTIASEARKSAEEALQKQEDSFTQPDTVTDGGEDGAWGLVLLSQKFLNYLVRS